MKTVTLIVAVIALIGLPFGLFAVFHDGAIGGPILLSSAIYLGLFSIACRLDRESRPKS